MIPRRMLIAIICLFACQIPIATQAFSQTTCRAEVKFSWKKVGEETANEVIWGIAEAQDKTEEDAKAALGEQIIRSKLKAGQICRKNHENLSGCVATKYSTMASVMQRLGFAARKALEKAIAADCAAQQGTCKGTSTSEPICTTEKVEPEEGEEDEEDEGKGKKKGKKKK